MSGFSNVESRIIDPVFDRANLRVEFRLPSMSAFLSDLRLINVGMTSTNGTDSPNPLLGILGAIKRISILDGSTQLDAINLATVYNAFKNANTDNDSNLSVNRFLKFVELGYVAQGDYTITGNQINRDQITFDTQNPITYTGSALNSKKSWLSLKDLLPFLRSSLVLPTTVFKNLRVVVEYNSASAMQYLTKDSSATKSTNADSLLLCSEIGDGDMKEALMREYKGVVYRPIETEQVVAPPITGMDNVAGQGTKKQLNNYRLTGYTGKKLIRLAVVQTPTNSATWLNGTDVKGYADVGSVAQYKTETQLIVNGSAKLPSAGMQGSATATGANRRLAYLNDTWGVFNTIPCQNWINFNDGGNFYANGGTIGEMDYLGIMVDENIAELRLNYNRTGIFGNAKQNQQLLLNIFGEVEKAVVMNKDMTYNVIYTQ